MSNPGPRAIRPARRARAGLLAVVCAGAWIVQDPEPRTPLAGTGPMRDLLARGVAAAPVTAGLAFALSITRDGNLIAGPWSLKAPGAARPLTLSLEEPSWE